MHITLLLLYHVIIYYIYYILLYIILFYVFYIYNDNDNVKNQTPRIKEIILLV